jgi:hypothetical protein
MPEKIWLDFIIGWNDVVEFGLYGRDCRFGPLANLIQIHL